MSIQEFAKTYGWRGLTVMVQEFIEKSPEFEEDGALARELGICLANLESALQRVQETQPD